MVTVTFEQKLCKIEGKENIQFIVIAELWSLLISSHGTKTSSRICSNINLLTLHLNVFLFLTYNTIIEFKYSKLKEIQRIKSNWNTIDWSLKMLPPSDFEFKKNSSEKNVCFAVFFFLCKYRSNVYNRSAVFFVSCI